MAQDKLIINAKIVNEGEVFEGALLVSGETIQSVYREKEPKVENCEVIDAKGQLLIPGVIDDQVHFREPGLMYKADIATESRAAVAGGTTSFMEMPNTSPQTTTQEALEKKYALGAEKSLANYSFYIGATNDNIEELLKTDPKRVCGIKVFMGSSTGNMLVDNEASLRQIFSKSKLLIATHCEDEETIRKNTEEYKDKYGPDMPIVHHADIRSDEACYLSSSFAVKLAKEYNTRLHVLHLSSAKEMELFRNDIPSKEKRITGEVCVHHLWFDSQDYEKYGTRIKWNPAVKYPADRIALWEALMDDRLDVIATDHAPHTLHEKENGYFKAPSGGPLVQHSLVAMLEFHYQGKISLEKIVDKMCHKPAEIYQVEKRGFIRPGYKADLVLVDMDASWTVQKDNIHYKCEWSPFEGTEFHAKVMRTFVNGNIVYDNGEFVEEIKGQRLSFDR